MIVCYLRQGKVKYSKVPELVAKAERMGLDIPMGFCYKNYIVGTSTAAEMLFQMKIFFSTPKTAYDFFRKHFVIDYSVKEKLEVKLVPWLMQSYN